MADPDTILPRGVRKRGSSFYVDYKVMGRRCRHVVSATSPEEAAQQRDKLVSEAMRLHPWRKQAGKAIPPELSIMPWADPSKWMQTYFARVARNAVARGIEVQMTADEAITLLAETGGYCSLTGLPFSDRRQAGWRVAPFKPSLDRVRNNAPYSANNCRWICAAANIALNDYGENVFSQIALAYAERVLRAARYRA